MLMVEVTLFDNGVEVGTDDLIILPVVGEVFEIFDQEVKAIAVRDLGNGCFEVDGEYV